MKCFPIVFIILYFKQNGVLGNCLCEREKWWPNNTMPVSIDKAFSNEQIDVIRLAFKIFTNNTCLKIVEDDTYKAYVNISMGAAGSGCSSSVGYLGSTYILSLANNTVNKGCIREYIIVHELAHAAGMIHQHSAHNRNLYVLINWLNMAPSSYSAFEQRFGTTSFDLPYDPASITHYGPKTASINGKDTITCLTNCTDMGQRRYLSEIDIKKINKMYECALGELPQIFY